MKVVVTGGAGFIGANLCSVLSATDGIDQVVAFDDLSTGDRRNLDSVATVSQARVSLVVGSILDQGALGACCCDADAIVHLAARPSVPRSLADPAATHEANATGTLRVLEAARGARRSPHVIVASSSSVYGSNPAPVKHEGLVPAPMSPYAASKLAGEAYARAWAASFGLETLTFRFFNVFGPLQPAGHAYAAVVPAFVSAALASQPVTIYGDGHQTRDFTYVDSVTTILAEAVLRRVVSPDPVNLAFGGRASLIELLAMLEEVLGCSVARVHAAPRVGDVRDSQADSSRLRALFPDCRPVPVAEGLAATVRWFVDGVDAVAAPAGR